MIKAIDISIFKWHQKNLYLLIHSIGKTIIQRQHDISAFVYSFFILVGKLNQSFSPLMRTNFLSHLKYDNNTWYYYVIKRKKDKSNLINKSNCMHDIVVNKEKT